MTAKGVPRGRGSTLSDDVNGDGYPDAVITAKRTEGGVPGQPKSRSLVVLYGSGGGLDPQRRSVVRPGDHTLWSLGSEWRARRPESADLDGDGYADIPIRLGLPSGPDPALHIVWGGPAGPVTSGLSPVVPVPRLGIGPSQWPAVGDFDGDGEADLAMALPASGGPPDERGGYTVLYGPFGRDGRPSRTFVLEPDRPDVPWWDATWVVADRIGPGRRSGLILHDSSDGEQSEGVVMPEVPSLRVHRLGPGNAIATGDFDGDGRRDVAVGDDGSRNDEPGAETVGVTQAITVYYGRAPRAPEVIRIPGLRDKLTVADVDGDGRDDLVFRVGRRIELLAGGLSERRKTDWFGCFGDDYAATPIRAGDYDRDGRAEVLIDCWTYYEREPDPNHWLVWDSNAPLTGFDVSGFAP
ncbi:histidine kinase [Planobispora takensis]|uniref:Histidine kinase n=1 Tax=Planobispora takensis TaxID=1367882 RepID=A0A8J3T1M6_9ACTN|nr:histidine kinase [Planobispora takensis]